MPEHAELWPAPIDEADEMADAPEAFSPMPEPIEGIGPIAETTVEHEGLDTEWPVRDKPFDEVQEMVEAEGPAEQPEPAEALDMSQAASQQGHSLRARLGTAEAEVIEPERASLWSRLIDWIEAKLRRG